MSTQWVLPHENLVVFSKHTENSHWNMNEVHKLDVMFWFFGTHTDEVWCYSMVEMSLNSCKNMVDIICVDAQWSSVEVVKAKKKNKLLHRKKKRKTFNLKKSKWIDCGAFGINCALDRNSDSKLNENSIKK